MDNPTNSRPPRYRWPWFLLAGIILGLVLAILWVNAAVRRVRDYRDPTYRGFPAPTTHTNAMETLPPSLAGFEDVLQGGNAEAGRKLFFESPVANCVKCHRLNGAGGENGPALDGIGARVSRAFILESILFPNAVITTNFETAIVVLTSGAGVAGTIRKETEGELVLNTPENGMVTVEKSSIRIRQEGASPMPEGIGEQLSRTELRDLLEFVARAGK